MGLRSTARGDRRRWRRARGPALAAVVGLVVGGFGVANLTEASPVGHFASAEGKDRYLAAYDTAMRELPPAQRTLDLRTSYGIVRVYRFAGVHDDEHPLLLLPGRAAGTPMWADNLPSLLRQRSAYVVDLLGEPGMSVQDRPFTGHADQAAWLHEVLAQLPEEQVHVVGHSIGGWTAMNLVVHQPEKVASLTLIEPVLVFADLTLEAVVRSIPASLPWLPKGWRDDFNSWTAGGAPVEDEPLADLIEVGMHTYRLEVPTPTRIDRQDLAALGVPTLVILAEESAMHDAQPAAKVARQTLRDASVEVYPGASHAVIGEQPDQIAADLAEHLAGLDRLSGGAGGG